MNKADSKSHWNEVYDSKEQDQLGWYEESPEPSLKLIEKSKIKTDDIIFNPGAGTTTLVNELITRGFSNIIVNDISSSALQKLKKCLGNKSEGVQWIVDDLTRPTKLLELEKVDLWHDRAVLHFFTDERDRSAYFDLLKALVKPNGHVIIAVFNLEGATKCSGLPVVRYDTNMLTESLGHDFSLCESFDYTYTMPSGDTREYLYTMFKRTPL